MQVGLLPLMAHQPVICPGLNGSQFVRVSWLPERSLQEWVGGDKSERRGGDVRERERQSRGKERGHLSRSRELRNEPEKGGEPFKAYFEYLQILETGHAGDAVRDGAGELVVAEVPAVVGRRRRE